MASPCPDISELELFADGRLRADSAVHINSHLGSCTACQELIGEVRENLRLVSPMRAVMSKADSRIETTSAPERIRDYRIIREIGRGGMGIVYEAEQPEPRRRVAIKVLHPGLGTGGRIERMFRREASALARLKHPGIAAIYEAGRASDGRLFFAMELVSGTSLTAHAASKRLSIRERLLLFKQVCEAIAYAHQRGVIHRDLKPSNILVVDGHENLDDSRTLSDRATPRILDFGLAKILEADDEAPAVTAVTEEGRIQGTIPYMSPEQVRGDLHDVDVRSDVYSLGVVLHELLSGKLPYPIDSRGMGVSPVRLVDAARTICETPPTRLSAIDPALRGDIETIVLKALEKDPARRYSSAAALAEDIGRMLSDQPILARPPTLRYQLRKLVSRHKVASALVASIAVLLVAFSISMGVLYARANANLLRAQDAEKLAEAETNKARREAQIARQVTTFLSRVFQTNDPDVSKGATITARQLLDRASEQIKSSHGTDPLVTAALLEAIGNSYGSLGMYDKAIALLENACQLRRDLSPGSMELASTAKDLAEVYELGGDSGGAVGAYREALEIMKRQRGADDIHVTMIMRSLIDVLQKSGQMEASESVLSELLERLRSSPHGRQALPGALNSLAGARVALERHEEAIPLMKEAVEIAARDGLGETTTLARLKANLAWTLALAGHYDEAEPIIREVIAFRRKVLPAGHPDFASSALTLGVVLMHRGQLADAESQLREALTARTSYLPANDPELLEVMGYLGECLTLRQKYEEAEKLLLDCHDAMTKSQMVSPNEVAAAAARLQRHYTARGMTAESARWRARSSK